MERFGEVKEQVSTIICWPITVDVYKRQELEHSKVVFEYAQKVIEKKKDSFFHDAVVEEETYRILAEAIDKLPDQMRAIRRLAMEGKKNGEIAEQLNVSVETVHTLKKIAYKKLRVYLKEYYYFLIFFYL